MSIDKNVDKVSKLWKITLPLIVGTGLVVTTYDFQSPKSPKKDYDTLPASTIPAVKYIEPDTAREIQYRDSADTGETE